MAQSFKYEIRKHLNFYLLTPDHREALDMIFNKIARIIIGDPNYIDSWQDIAGYATLVFTRLQKEQSVEQ